MTKAATFICLLKARFGGGWLTLSEVAAVMQLPEDVASEACEELVDEGLMECGKTLGASYDEWLASYRFRVR